MSFAEQLSPNSLQTLRAQHSPGMKMLLGEDVRFEWKKMRDRDDSDMMLTLRGNGESILSMSDARALITACHDLGMRGWLHGDYSRPSSYKIHGKIDAAACTQDDVVPRGGMLITPLDFDAARIRSAVDVSQFSLKISAATYKDVIQTRQKSLAIGG